MTNRNEVMTDTDVPQIRWRHGGACHRSPVTPRQRPPQTAAAEPGAERKELFNNNMNKSLWQDTVVP
jgi:hypothetical protein